MPDTEARDFDWSEFDYLFAADDDDGDEDDYYFIGCEALTAAERNPSMIRR